MDDGFHFPDVKHIDFHDSDVVVSETCNPYLGPQDPSILPKLLSTTLIVQNHMKSQSAKPHCQSIIKKTTDAGPFWGAAAKVQGWESVCRGVLGIPYLKIERLSNFHFMFF